MTNIKNDDIYDKANYDAVASILSLTLNNNVLLRTLLSVIIEKHVESKSPDDAKAFRDLIDQIRDENLKISNQLMIHPRK